MGANPRCNIGLHEMELQAALFYVLPERFGLIWSL
jgi:hypothetical protein